MGIHVQPQHTHRVTMSKFADACKLPYAEQGKFFLNAYWDECGADAQKVYDACALIIEVDNNNKQGTSVEEDMAHVFLEKMGNTMTVIALRNLLRDIDITQDKKLSFLEYLLYSFGQEHECVNVATIEERPQGDNTALYT